MNRTDVDGAAEALEGWPVPADREYHGKEGGGEEHNNERASTLRGCTA